jgi:hypothetical protein
MVQRGKPAALMPIQKRYVAEAMNHIEQYDDLNCCLEALNDDWYSLWIYKHEFLLDVIKSVPDEPKTVYDHWVLGKLFGYDESSIGEFIKKQMKH